MSEFSKEMSEAWRTLPEEEKTKYQRRYHIERDKLEEDNKMLSSAMVIHECRILKIAKNLETAYLLHRSPASEGWLSELGDADRRKLSIGVGQVLKMIITDNTIPEESKKAEFVRKKVQME
ncbi:10076_t:CDS:2 [Funneliformis geosporum]|uniref:10076_t:CDS:1 n=1 Tax=Funneliformis geosporum TaxID=1117311 RepID=A0A9W4WK01_9GLOM|nr:10076_t:CDS:2 [Funneliformis geosporum]